MQKRSTCFLVMSAVVAVLATGCASKKGAETETPAESTTAGLEAQRQTSEHNVTNTSWANVDSGPLSIIGVVGVGRFDGEAECYASAGPTCANPSSAGANRGTLVFSCGGGRCVPENGGRVEAGRILCCGSNNGRGGKLRVTYAK